MMEEARVGSAKDGREVLERGRSHGIRLRDGVILHLQGEDVVLLLPERRTDPEKDRPRLSFLSEENRVRWRVMERSRLARPRYAAWRLQRTTGAGGKDKSKQGLGLKEARRSAWHAVAAVDAHRNGPPEEICESEHHIFRERPLEEASVLTKHLISHGGTLLK